MTIIDELAYDINKGQSIFRAPRVKKLLFHAGELQDKLTMAINVNIEMQRQIRELRAELEQHTSGVYLQTCQLANAQMDKTIKQLREQIKTLEAK